MRALKWLLAIVVLVAVLAGILLATLPAGVARRWAANSPRPLAMSGVDGSIWRGHADSVSLFGHDLGALDWTLAKRPMFTGRLVTDFHLSGAGIDAAGELTRERGGALSAAGLRFRFPAARLAPLVPAAVGALRGTVSGTLDSASVVHDLMLRAQGEARWSEVGFGALPSMNCPDLLARFAPAEAGGIEGTIGDGGGGDFGVAGTFSLKPSGYSLDIRLAPRTGDPAVRAILQQLGRSEADGSIVVALEGRLPAGWP